MKRIHVMCDSLRSKMGWLAVGWFWCVVLLVLPNCSFTPGSATTNNGPNLDPGSEPKSSAIFCDIEKERHCANPTEKAMGIRLAAAAVALNTGQTGSTIGLDDSPEALARCAGEPEAVIFADAFPRGKPVCVNCVDTLGTHFYSDANKVCIAQCEDTFGQVVGGNFVPDNPPTDANRQFCESYARVSTNAPVDNCFDNICTSAGTPNSPYVDPRQFPEAVIWQDLIGVVASGNNLTKTSPTSPDPTLLNAGAASSQRLTRGDGYVEFSAAETNRTHLLGLAAIPSACPAPCADTDPSQNDVGFGIALNLDGRFYVLESGNLISGPGPQGSFGSYSAGERFRVSLSVRSDGAANVSYSRIVGACVPGSVCNEQVFHVSTATPPRFPFRVDAAFREINATLTDVRIVRIQ